MFYRLLICTAIMVLAGIRASFADVNRLPIASDWTGCEALRTGDYSTALQQILMDSNSTDTVSRDFKLAVLYYRLKNYSTSLLLFRNISVLRPELTPSTYLYIAEIELELGRSSNALAAYRSVLRLDIPKKLRLHIYKKIQNVFSHDATLAAEQVPWLEDFYAWQAASDRPRGTSVYDTIITLISSGNTIIADSLLNLASVTTTSACLYAAFADTCSAVKQLTPPSLYKTARIAHRCGNLELAKRLFTLLKKDQHLLGNQLSRDYGKAFAELLFDKQEWNNAIRWYKKYIATYGNDPDAIFSIARAYRKLDKIHDASIWYDRLLKVYPRHPKTEEIFWLRAWQYEDKHQYRQAASYYKTIISRYKKGSRLDESYLRCGICSYRLGEYDSGAVLLQSFEDKSPLSNHVNAARFWRAKCYLASGKSEDAVLLLRLLSYRDPFDYYAHRSRQLLLELNDTARIAVDTLLSESEVLAWFDSLTSVNKSRKQLSLQDSTDLLCGTFFAMAGDVEKADYFIDPVESSLPGNLSLQYKLVNLFQAADASAPAYRIARKLTWRIPPECKTELPLSVYKIFFPTFYSSFITESSTKNGIDPHLVSGIIRQESIFDPKIVSPAGAIGLMQIMPYTGKYISGKLQSSFTVDSLYQPHFNVRFGTYYIKELIDQFQGNIMLALAGYNAGPHNAARWAKENKDKELDLFVEDIGFSETRGYVKKVMSNFWTYKVLAGYPRFGYGR